MIARRFLLLEKNITNTIVLQTEMIKIVALHNTVKRHLKKLFWWLNVHLMQNFDIESILSYRDTLP